MKNRTLSIFIILCSFINVFFLASGILIGIFGFAQPYFAIFVTLFMFAYHLDSRIIVAVILNLFRKDINIDRRIYHISEKEYKRLDRLKVRYWKDHFITMFKDRFVFSGSSRNERVVNILKNNINAEVTHWLCFFIGFLAILFGYLISSDELVIYLVTSILASFLFDFPSILIQRYNRYRLLNLRRMTEKKK